MYIIAQEVGDIYLDSIDESNFICSTGLTGIFKVDITPDGKYLIAMTPHEYQIHNLRTRTIACTYTGRYYGFVISHFQDSRREITYWLYIQSENGILTTEANDRIVERTSYHRTYYNSPSTVIRQNDLIISKGRIAYTVSDNLFIFSDSDRNPCTLNIRQILGVGPRRIYFMNDGRTLVVLAFDNMLIFDVEYGMRYGEYGRTQNEMNLPKYRYWVRKCNIDVAFVYQLSVGDTLGDITSPYLLVGMGDSYNLFRYEYKAVNECNFISKLFGWDCPLKLELSSKSDIEGKISNTHHQPIFPNEAEDGVVIRTRDSTVLEHIYFYTSDNQVRFISSYMIPTYENARYIAKLNLYSNVRDVRWSFNNETAYHINTVDMVMSPSLIAISNDVEPIVESISSDNDIVIDAENMSYLYWN